MESPKVSLSQRFGDPTAANGGLSFQGYVAGDVTLQHAGRGGSSELFDDLPEAAFNSRSKEHWPSCLENTRQSLLEKIHNWADAKDGKHIYWLKGMAGTGKSTVALTVARQYNEKGRLCASFFFSRGGGDLASAGKFARTIVSQLRRTLPGHREHVDNVVKCDPDIRKAGLYEQWEKLVLQPLMQLGKGTSPAPSLIVVDALDECDNEDDVSLLIQCLAEAAAVKDIYLRIFVTSRPEQRIHFGFSRISPDAREDFILHNIEHSIVDQDLELFYEDRLMHIAKRFNLGDSLISDGAIQTLVQKSDRLFIYAATACRFIYDGRELLAKERLSSLINLDNKSTHPEKELYQMYAAVLEQSFTQNYQPGEVPRVYTVFNRVVGSIVVLFDTMTPFDLSSLLSESQHEILAMLRCLYSVLDIAEQAGGRIRLVHPSFRDFLLDPTRASDRGITVDAKATHRDLLFCCLRLMKEYLKRNMCNIESPGTRVHEIPKDRIDQLISHPVQYACRNWIYHLEHSCVNLDEEILEMIDFFHGRFLYWLETLAWIGRLSEGVTMVKLLAAILARQSNSISNQSMLSKLKSKRKQNPEMHSPRATLSLVSDAMRFLLLNFLIIEEAPLQIYCSALLFAPRDIQQPVPLKNWTSHQQTINLLGNAIQVIVSLDGELVASAHEEDVIYIWNATTGKNQRTFHSPFIKWIAFSPDSRILASTGKDRAIRIWDVATGQEQRAMISNYRCAVMAIGLYRSDQHLIASAGDEYVNLWDAITGEMLHILRGHSDEVMMLSFSPDGRLLVSIAKDDTIRLWDVATGKELDIFHYRKNDAVDRLRLKGFHNIWPCLPPRHLNHLQDYVTFSADGQLVISIGFPNTIQLWNVATGRQQHRYRIHGGSIGPLTVLSDGRLVFITNEAKRLRLWHLTEGSEINIEQHQFPKVYQVAFSPDSRLVASWSDDYIIRLWDGNTGIMRHIFKDSRRWVRTIAFSPDSQSLASVTTKRMSLWDVATGTKRRTIRASSMGTVGFSPNGQLILGFGVDSLLKAWDVATGEERTINHNPVDSTTTIAISTDNQLIAQAGYHSVIHLIDAASGMMRHTLFGHWAGITAVTFSPDSRLIASAGADRRICVWDVATGRAIHIIRADTIVRYLAFSSCGSRLITNKGIFMLSSDEFRAPGSLSVSNNWIHQDGKDILYIPPEYEGNLSFTYRNVVCFQNSKHPLRIDLSSSKSMIY
ncbi:WD40-repeat-containing domain protein [Xylaria bambusicola]|uniref:WD40-repeat-containing domain protein n=1 Tax=Xylaria bambusicola TaxID=326684 RepID=UPI002008C8AB|nr:WD40-repeat-containing domain protein [Xylaria bambusicola]KAI0506295.1 WD40-repeat-containing domain protein [Xylaria bambusicola]